MQAQACVVPEGAGEEGSKQLMECVVTAITGGRGQLDGLKAVYRAKLTGGGILRLHWWHAGGGAAHACRHQGGGASGEAGEQRGGQAAAMSAETCMELEQPTGMPSTVALLILIVGLHFKPC